MGRFSGVKEAKYNEGGVFVLPSIGLVRIDKVLCDITRKKKKFFAVEMTVLECDNPERKTGAFQTWMVMEEWETYLGTVKHFAAIANDIELEEVDEEGCELMVSDENPLGGTLLRYVAVNAPGKSGGDFTKVVWKPATPEDKKKWAGSLPPVAEKPQEQKSA